MFIRGVTLLEMLVVMLVVAVIAALALPSYRQYLVRVNRGEATSGLYAIAAAEERFHLRHGRYTDDIRGGAPLGLGLALDGASSRYQFSVAMADDGQTYIASATPTSAGGQSTDGECLVFSIDHRGRRAASGSREPAFCWR